MYNNSSEAMGVIREITLKADLRGKNELILRTAPQYCQSAINFNLMNVCVGGLVHKDKLDGTEFGAQKVKYQCKQLVPEERKNDLTILSEIEYFQPFQHYKEVSEFWPNEYILKGLRRTLNGVVYEALVAQPQVLSSEAFKDATKWKQINEEI